MKLGRGEDGGVGFEGHLRARLLGIADDRQRPHRSAATVLLKVHVPLAADLHLEPLADGVDGAHADPMQPGADLVARVVELAAGVEDGHHHLGRAHPALGHDADGNPPAVVLHGDRAVEVDDDVHPRAEPAEVLVHRVVDHLPDQMVQARPVVHVADVHARPLAHGLQPFEDGDARAVVVRGRGGAALRTAHIRHRGVVSFAGIPHGSCPSCRLEPRARLRFDCVPEKTE